MSNVSHLGALFGVETYRPLLIELIMIIAQVHSITSHQVTSNHQEVDQHGEKKVSVTFVTTINVLIDLLVTLNSQQ